MAALKQEAKEFEALAAMIEEGEIRTSKELAREYLPHRERSVEKMRDKLLQA